MNKLLKRLKINETYTKPPKIVYDSVKENTLPMDGYNYMADLLFMPQTKQRYKYLLTMVDIWSNEVDFEPLRNKKSQTVLDAMKTIFARGILEQPKSSIRTDNGSEFKDVFHRYLYEHSILHRVSEPYRHNQLANVERLNRELGRLFNGYMNRKEIETGKVYREWTDIIPIVREEINKVRPIRADQNVYEIKFPDVKTDSKYKVGDLVMYKSEVPLNALGQRQNTLNFRMGDLRYHLEPKKIKQILYYPNNVRYILDGLPNVSYAESELLLPSGNAPKKVPSVRRSARLANQRE